MSAQVQHQHQQQQQLPNILTNPDLPGSVNKTIKQLDEMMMRPMKDHNIGRDTYQIFVIDEEHEKQQLEERGYAGEQVICALYSDKKADKEVDSEPHIDIFIAKTNPAYELEQKLTKHIAEILCKYLHTEPAQKLIRNLHLHLNVLFKVLYWSVQNNELNLFAQIVEVFNNHKYIDDYEYKQITCHMVEEYRIEMMVYFFGKFQRLFNKNKELLKEKFLAHRYQSPRILKAFDNLQADQSIDTVLDPLRPFFGRQCIRNFVETVLLPVVLTAPNINVVLLKKILNNPRYIFDFNESAISMHVKNIPVFRELVKYDNLSGNCNLKHLDHLIFQVIKDNNMESFKILIEESAYQRPSLNSDEYNKIMALAGQAAMVHRDVPAIVENALKTGKVVIPKTHGAVGWKCAI